MEAIISLEKVSKVYRSGSLAYPALREVNLEIGAGANVVITGASGSGKSTLLNLIAGIDRADSGDIRVGGTDLKQLNERALAAWRGRNVGIVFQFFQLLPTLSVLDNLILPMEFLGKVPKDKRKGRALELLDQTGIADQARKYPFELSGGQQQRVAIARALANDPPLIVADEPTGNLDSENSERIRALFAELNRQGRTVLTVTHDVTATGDYDQVIRMSDGKIGG